MDHRFDLIIRRIEPESITRLEYGAREASRHYATKDNKFIKEGGEKLPRVLKDILDMLIEENLNYYNNLSTLGLIHSILHLQVIVADRPKGYIPRIESYKNVNIPVDVSEFGEQVLLVLAQIYKIKRHVAKMYKLVKENKESRVDDSDWSEQSNKKTPKIIIIVTSSSTETSSRK